MDAQEWAAYRERHGLVSTSHERVWWSHDPPDDRAFDAATTIADEFPSLKVVGTESRTQLSDVQWNLDADQDVLVMGFYPIRADFWTQETIADVRKELA